MPAVDRRSDAPRYILLTQCLQNDFFLSTRCRLRLSETIVRELLLGKREDDPALLEPGNQYDKKRAARIRRGPFGIFLDAVVGKRFDGSEDGMLHLINVRDWHGPGAAYDAERRIYGPHCERDTWGAKYLDGLDELIDPSGDGRYTERGNVRVYHIRSDSLFDFKPHSEDRGDARRKFRAGELEDVLDILVQGTAAQVEEMADTLRDKRDLRAIHELARAVDEQEPSPGMAPLYVAVVGVYTDIKVQLALMGLRTQYDLPNLAVSDTFTASFTLERHLAGLDYASKVLDVEVIHGINDLVRFFGGGDPVVEDESKIVARSSFARYRTFFQDKQNVLAYQDEKLRQYLQLTENRALEVYDRIKKANTFLMIFGGAFMAATLVFAILNAIWPDRFDWKIAAVTGGIGLLQIVSAFFSRPVRDLQNNLNNLAVFKMILESHSLKTAFARFHLTTPGTLRELGEAGALEAANRQVAALKAQVGAIQEFDTADFADLAKLAAVVGEGAPVAATNGVPAAPIDEAVGR